MAYRRIDWRATLRYGSSTGSAPTQGERRESGGRGNANRDRSPVTDPADDRGLSRHERYHHGAAARHAGGVADGPGGGAGGLFGPVHGKGGEFPETLFSRLPAWCLVRQAGGDFGLFPRHRDGGDRVHRPGARHPSDHDRHGPADLWRRVGLRRGVRGLSVRRRNVPAGRYPQAPDPRHNRPWRADIHHGCVAGHAADPEHHSGQLLWHHGLGRAHIGADRVGLHRRDRPCLSWLAAAQPDGGGGGLWRAGAAGQRTRPAGRRRNRAPDDRPAAAAGRGSGQFAAHHGDPALGRGRRGDAGAPRHGRSGVSASGADGGAVGGGGRALAVDRHHIALRLRYGGAALCRRIESGCRRRAARGHEHGGGIWVRRGDRGAARLPDGQGSAARDPQPAGQRSHHGDVARRDHGVGIGWPVDRAGGDGRSVRRSGRCRRHPARSAAPGRVHGVGRDGQPTA